MELNEQVWIVPAFEFNDVFYCFSRNSELPRYSRVGSRHGPYLAHLNESEFGIVSTFSKLISSFISHVLLVVFPGSQKQVIGIDASWVIPSRTVMAYDHSFGNLTTAKNPRRSWRFYKRPESPVSPAVFINDSITVLSERSGPKPASVGTRRFIHLIPKAFREVFGKTLRSQILGRNLLHRQFVCGCGLLAPAASLLWPKPSTFQG